MLEFENPALLHFLWGIFFQGLLLFFYWQWRRNTLRRLGSADLEERLLQGFSARRFWLKNLLFALVMVCVVVAIANPRRAVSVQPAPLNSSDILIALDVSNSMLARDVAPNRLDKSKLFIQDLIPKLDGERIGLIFFAGEPQPQAPLSTDFGALLLYVRNATPAFIADQGTDIAAAIHQASRMFEGKTQAGKALILISDGENHQEDAIEAAQKAKAEGMQIYTVVAGTAAGASISDANGASIRTRSNEPFLRELALAGGGQPFNIMEDGAIGGIDAALAQLPKATVSAQSYTDYYTYYPWVLLLAVLLLAVEQLLWWKR